MLSFMMTIVFKCQSNITEGDSLNGKVFGHFEMCNKAFLLLTMISLILMKYLQLELQLQFSVFLQETEGGCALPHVLCWLSYFNIEFSRDPSVKAAQRHAWVSH